MILIVNAPLAILNGNSDFSKKLICFGALLKDLTENNSNALHLCNKVNNHDLASHIIEKDSGLLNMPNNDNDLPHHLAVEFNHEEMLNFYLHQKEVR